MCEYLIKHFSVYLNTTLSVNVPYLLLSTVQNGSHIEWRCCIHREITLTYLCLTEFNIISFLIICVVLSAISILIYKSVFVYAYIFDMPPKSKQFFSSHSNARSHTLISMNQLEFHTVYTFIFICVLILCFIHFRRKIKILCNDFRLQAAKITFIALTFSDRQLIESREREKIV